MQSLSFIRAYFIRLATRRWRVLLLIFILVSVPVLIIQWAMIQEQDSYRNSYWSSPTFGLAALLLDNSDTDQDSRKTLDGSDELGLEAGIKGWLGYRQIPTVLQRSAQYCNMPVPRGEEGEPPWLNNKTLNTTNRSHWRLAGAVVILRHGARTPLHSNFEEFGYGVNCSLGELSQYKDSELDAYLRTLQSSAQQLGSPQITETPFTFHATICEKGDLSPIGILQLFALGRRLAHAYRELLPARSAGPLRVTSTRTSRTIKSTRAFLHAILLRLNNGAAPGGIRDLVDGDIQTADDLSFCRPSVLPCSCPALRYHFGQFKMHETELYSHDEHAASLRNALASFFRVAPAHAPRLISHYLDRIMPVTCAQTDLKQLAGKGKLCWPEPGAVLRHFGMGTTIEGSRCLPLSLLDSLWKVDDKISAAVQKTEPFQKYSKLAMYPLLRDIAALLAGLPAIVPSGAQTPAESKNGEKKRLSTSSSKRNSSSQPSNLNPQPHTATPAPTRLHLYVGHDISLRYLVSALGISPPQPWPPFASRLAIELYTSTGTQDQQPRRVFRVLYNGRDVTGQLPACAGGGIPCPLPNLDRYLAGAFWNQFTSRDYGQQCVKPAG